MKKKLLPIIVFIALNMFPDKGYSQTTPTVPENLTVMSVNFCSIGITWIASTDDIGVTGYNIYRDNVLRFYRRSTL